KKKKQAAISARKLVLDCPLPDLHPNIEQLTVCPDLAGGGVFILDVTNSNNKTTFISTKSPITLHLPKQIKSVRVLDRREEVTKCRLIEVEVKEGEFVEGIGEGGSKFVGCMVTDEVLMRIIRKSVGSERMKGGGGRGGGGRGGGRRRREDRD
ncbi:hypothetical protein TeGR_g10356, partial [Tetraparma gracilis]